MRVQRAGALAAAASAEPVIVEYARSFFPIILIVLLIRSFLFEPFRIPSDSMMPTLLDGDFIFVNKFTYGLRLPVLNTEIVDARRAAARRRRRVPAAVRPVDELHQAPRRPARRPRRGRATSAYTSTTSCSPCELDGMFRAYRQHAARADRHRAARRRRSTACSTSPSARRSITTSVVPDGHYFFMGDNRDNSRDSRFPEVGFVPAGNVVGKAVRIWLNWNLPNAPIWNRIGDAIH